MFEVEIKSLLGSKENADALRERLKNHDAKLTHHGSHSQLNHYFVVPEAADEVDVAMQALEDSLMEHVPDDSHQKLRNVLEEGEDYSIRTRDADGTVLVVIKASVGDDTSHNGVSRIEFEEEIDMSLDELDQLLLDAGLEYQAKWSRQREEYTFGEDVNVTIDKNAGYGYLAEFEKEIESEDEVGSAEDELRELMSEVGLEELEQDRLERMFAHYNENWEEYYGTDDTFTIE